MKMANNEAKLSLPKAAEEFLRSRGMKEYMIVCQDGRSYIIIGINDFMGETRPFLCRVFLNGYVRDWIALPAEETPKIAQMLLEYAKKVIRE